MKYAIKIHKISTVDQLKDAWSIEDYKQLLDKFGFPDAQSTNLEELQGLLHMSIADFETNEAAKILLEYKLSDHLTEGQIDQLSHEMLSDRISEEYPVISLHKDLFSINQLLYKAYNGKFLNTKATVINFEITPLKNANTEITKEIVLKCLVNNLDSHNIIIRLFAEQLNGNEKFEEANDIIWSLTKNETDYTLTTSDYWMSKEEFLNESIECNIAFFEEV